MEEMQEEAVDLILTLNGRLFAREATNRKGAADSGRSARKVTLEDFKKTTPEE